MGHNEYNNSKLNGKLLKDFEQENSIIQFWKDHSGFRNFGESQNLKQGDKLKHLSIAYNRKWR